MQVAELLDRGVDQHAVVVSMLPDIAARVVGDDDPCEAARAQGEQPLAERGHDAHERAARRVRGSALPPTGPAMYKVRCATPP